MADVSRKGFIKTANLKTGDVLEFMTAGDWVKRDFSKGQTGNDIKEVFECKVELNGDQSSPFIINRTSLDSLSDGWGTCDTTKWIGRKAEVNFVDMVAFGKRTKVLCLKPILNEAEVNWKA